MTGWSCTRGSKVRTHCYALAILCASIVYVFALCYYLNSHTLYTLLCEKRQQRKTAAGHNNRQNSCALNSWGG